MTTCPETPRAPETLPFVVLAQRLLALFQAEDADVGTVLDALSHTYVAIVREQPAVALAASRSLMTAAYACTVPEEQGVRLDALSLDLPPSGIH